MPTHFLSAGPEKELTLRDGTEVEEGQLFTWDQRAGEAVSLPDFEEKVSAAHVFADTGVVWFVSEDNFDIGNQEFDEGDVVAYDPDADRYDLVRAGADLLDGVIDALYVAPDGTWLYSSDDETDTEGNGIEVLRGDIVRYDPSSDEHSVEIPAAALFDDDPDDANVVGLTVADGVLYFTMEDEGEVGGEAFVPGDVLGVQLDAVPQPAGRSLQVLAADRMIADEEALGALGLFVPRGWEPGLTPLP